MSRTAYLDASALVKLFKPERETPALRAELPRFPQRVSSELLAVEVRCAARRLGGGLRGRAELALTGVGLAPFDAGLRERAGRSACSPPLRALDAIHLATALSMASDLDAFFAYDADLCEAAASEGLPVRSPA